MPEAAQNAAGGSSSEPADPMAGFRALLKEATAAGATLTDREQKLLRENYRAREKLRLANDALTKAQADGAKVPKDAVVLSKEDAEAFTAFKALNLPVADVVKRLGERDQLAADRAKADGEKILDAVAEELGLNPRAFKRLVAAEGLTVTLKNQKVRDEETGKMVDEQVPVVRTRNAAQDAEPEDLAAVLERDFADDLDTLTVQGDGMGGRARDTGARTALRSSRRDLTADDEETESVGTRFPRTRSEVPSRQSTSRKQLQDAKESKAATGRYRL